MAQLLLTAFGSALGGPIGAFAGAVAGGAIDRRLFGPRNRGMRPGDLTAPKLTYGSELPRLAGTNITAGFVAWQSTKRAQRETVDTKGSSEQTVGFTHTVDVLIVLGVHDQEAVWRAIALTRAWVNGGDPVYSRREGADPDTAVANEAAPWDAIELCDGNPTQTSWAVQQAEMPDAPAYRGRTTVRITNLRLGSSTVLPHMKFETVTAGTLGPGDVFALVNFNGTPGATTAVDSSGWAQNAVLTNMQQVAGGAYGSVTDARSIGGSGGLGLVVSGETVPWNGQRLTIEANVFVAADQDQGFTLVSAITNLGSGFEIGLVLVDGTSPDQKRLELRMLGETTATDWVEPPDYPLGLGGRNHVEVVVTGGDTAIAFINGAEVLRHVHSAPPAVTSLQELRAGYASSGTFGAGELRVDGVRGTRNFARHIDGFTPPGVEPTDDVPGPVTPGTVSLGAIVQAESRRCGIPDALVDTSLIDAIAVRGYPSMGGARSALEHLCRMFHVGLVQDDALRYVPRGGASEATLPWADLGCGIGSAPAEPLDHDDGPDDEVPRKLALTFVSTEADGDPDTKTGDRGTGSQRRVATEETPLLLTPAEGLDLADALAALARNEVKRFKVAVSEAYARHQPTSVVLLTDRDGIQYRCRIVAEDWTLGVHQWELELDDASILTQAGIASSDREPTTSIPLPPLARLYVLDIPLLRLADEGPGEYVAVTATGRFRGVDVLKSSDDVTYTQVGTRLASRAIAGECDSALPAFGGWAWDLSSVLTVTLDDGAGGTLASATRTAIEASRSLNLAAVGAHGRWELIQFATATHLTGSTWQIGPGMLRNLGGTEDANASHEVGDTFVLLGQGLMRVGGAVSDLGQTRYYRAVPVGRSESSVAPVSIVCQQRCLLPYAPADVRNDAGTLRWARRSRHEGAVGEDPPLGENTERYIAELYDGVTLEEASPVLTSPEWTPATNPSGLTARVYQLSELVGRGLPAEAEMT